MKEVIERIHKRTTEYSHPSQATTTANALELLSSGIYTEEERFVFELLQNAVDSFDPNLSDGLDVKIVVKDNQLIFLHNGTPFSERDLEGLCDIGNGNKMSDSKKIGYKGIGFKSVFMHSQKVTVITSNTCFKFDREECKEIAKSKGSAFNDVKMPWQIIPIATELPTEIITTGYNVVTILEIHNGQKLLDKVNRLLSDARFILFLNVKNLLIRLFEEDKKILSLSKSLEGDLLTISKNNIPLNKWLMHSAEIKLNEYPDVKLELQHDVKTPDKLKNSETVEISFAIALDEDNNIVPLKNALIYTYLPTSFSFGFPFIVNANFITDAGRQQLIKDSEWNKFLFSLIPPIYLKWIKDTVSIKRKDWYKVLIPYVKGDNDLSKSYLESLFKALSSIPFVKSLSNKSCLVEEAFCDKINIINALNNDIYSKFINDLFEGDILTTDTMVPIDAYDYLAPYGIKKISLKDINRFLENSYGYLNGTNSEDIEKLLRWLKEISCDVSLEFKTNLKNCRIILSEGGEITTPSETFFSSKFQQQSEIASSAHILKGSLYDLMDEDLIAWLKEIGVQEMSYITLIDTIVCKGDYINEENAIETIKIIFETNKKESIFENISSYRLRNLLFLTKKGSLKKIRELYLSSEYHPHINIENLIDEDIFISDKYLTSSSDRTEWALFLEKLGINTDFSINKEEIKLADAEKNKLLSPAIPKCKKVGYDSYNGKTYYFYPNNFEVNCLPLMPLTPDPHLYGFCSYFWDYFFNKKKPEYHNEYINGASGFIGRTLNLSNYISENNFLDWNLKENQLFPTTMGTYSPIRDILENTANNLKLFGKYFPIINITNPIHETWKSVLEFKKDLTLQDYLDVLQRISSEDSKEIIADNKDRICRIYDRIADNFDFSEGSSNFNLIKAWGKENKILSKELEFVAPGKLCLLSDKITGVNIDNQVYHHKTQENNRFAEMMIAMGVIFINNHRVEGIENASLNNAVKNEIDAKTEFFTAITSSENFTEESWYEALRKMKEGLNKLSFFNVDDIKVVYGNQSINKPVYVKESNIYYSGKFNLAKKEMLTPDLVKILGLHRNDQTIFLTLLQMNHFEEIIDYLQLKGYDTQFIKRSNLPEFPSTGATLAGEGVPLIGLTHEHMKAALTEAKNTIINQLSISGFDVTHYSWDGWTCIDGITKEGIEYPLVIRSNKSGSNTKLSSIDWNQLMKPNAMFVVNTNSGVGTINFRELLRSKDNITIRFSSENIDNPDHISNLAEVFTYFKGLQFDFESYINPIIRRWESFLAPENKTGELPQAGNIGILPD